MKGTAVLLLIAAAATPARAVEIEDGIILAGIAGGLGAAPKGLGTPGLLGGQLLYHAIGEWGVGTQIDRFDYKAKGSVKADMTSILGVVRGNVGGISQALLPYVLFGLGYAESRADVPGGSDRGSGIGYALGLGVDAFLGARVSVGAELRLNRMNSPLSHAGIHGASVPNLVLRLNLWLGP